MKELCLMVRQPTLKSNYLQKSRSILEFVVKSPIIVYIRNHMRSSWPGKSAGKPTSHGKPDNCHPSS